MRFLIVIKLVHDTINVTTINTPFGCYQFNRLHYGMKVFPAIFQKDVEKIIGDHPNIIICQDDIAISASSIAELTKALWQCFGKTQWRK